MMKSEEMPNNALVSIIVPVYHAKEYIEKTIRSVEAQTFHDWELILVDDCGGDGSLERIREIKEASPCGGQIRIIQNEKNLGAAMSRNHGVEKALGRCLCGKRASDSHLLHMNSAMKMLPRPAEWCMCRISWIFGMRSAGP